MLDIFLRQSVDEQALDFADVHRRCARPKKPLFFLIANYGGPRFRLSRDLRTVCCLPVDHGADRDILTNPLLQAFAQQFAALLPAAATGGHGDMQFSGDLVEGVLFRIPQNDNSLDVAGQSFQRIKQSFCLLVADEPFQGTGG